MSPRVVLSVSGMTGMSLSGRRRNEHDTTCNSGAISDHERLDVASGLCRVIERGSGTDRAASTLNTGVTQMKAITTKYRGPTDTRGSRIIASDEDGNRITISYPHELSGEAVHRKAAEALCNKMNWIGELAAGSTKRGYVFVFVERAA